MRKFNITVNGKIYEVEVEEVGGVSTPSSSLTSAVTPKTSPAPEVAPATPTVPAVPNTKGGESVTAPMPGKILKVLKEEGSLVKRGEVVMILEAMKMENEITAPADGTIQQFRSQAGAAVNPGDVLFVIGI